MARRSNWPGREDVGLPGEFVEVARAHPRGERLVREGVRRRRGFSSGWFSPELENKSSRAMDGRLTPFGG